MAEEQVVTCLGDEHGLAARNHVGQHAADQRRGKPEITVPPLLFQLEQSGVAQLGKMPARRLRRDTRQICEL